MIDLMIKILIIGGNGYVGSELKILLSNYFSVDVYGKREQDFNLLSKEFLSNYTHIILLAGHAGVLVCDGPLKGVWNNNVRNFKNLVDKLDKQKLIYASTVSVYGDNFETETSFTEDMVSYSFVNNYDLVKITLDMLATGLIEQNRNIIGLRFGTVNGKSPIFRTDVMINSMTYSALTNGEITVTNKDVKRPILALKDLSRALHKIISSNFIPGIYNLASFNSTVGEIADTVGSVLNIPVIDRGKTNTYNFTVDCSKFEKTYNFTFTETIQSITNEVKHCIHDDSVIKVKRNTYFDYKG
jgi:nucleoside-diphosphate-sugar epimerase